MEPNAQDLKEALDAMEGYYDTHRYDAIVNKNLVPCQRCRKNLNFLWSHCTDLDCCDVPHCIVCEYCDFEAGDNDARELVERYLTEVAKKAIEDLNKENV